MNFLTLQPLTSEHLAEAVALDRRCLGGLWTESGYQREIESPNSDLLILQPIATDASVLDADQTLPPLIGLACAWSILDECHITLLAVDPLYRHRGFGQLLLYTLLVLAYDRGLEWATLEVRASNQTAIALYQKYGFESVGNRPKYYPNGEDALILWRRGLQRPEFQVALKQWQKQLGDRLQSLNYALTQFPNLDWKPVISIQI